MIIYPLPIPSAVGESKANLKKFDPVAEVISPFSGSAQQQQWLGNWWELDLEWPEMTWAQFAALDAFQGALKGKMGTFLWGPPLATQPRGSALTGGSPVANGTDLSGSNVLSTSGWLPSQSGLLLPGDYFQLGASVDSGITYALGTLTRTAGVITTAVPLSFAGDTGDLIYIAGMGDFNGGPFAITVSTTVVGGHISIHITWSQAGANETVTSAGTLTLAPLIQRLYQYVNPNPLASDGGGNALIDIFPNLREAPASNNSPLIFTNPVGTFRLAENRREAPATKTKTFTFKMKCREAI
jgi:hypothetical protein